MTLTWRLANRPVALNTGDVQQQAATEKNVSGWKVMFEIGDNRNILIVKWKEVVHPSRLCVGRLIYGILVIPL